MTSPDAALAARSFLIAARALNGVIGADGGIPWRSSGDMAYFRRRTMGCALVMGRATWDSLPGPLVGREVVVVSSKPTCQRARFEPTFDDAVARAASLGCSAIAFAGGRRIYEAALALPWLREAYVTEVRTRPEGDVLMPEMGTEWFEADAHRLPRSPDEPECVVRHLRRGTPTP